MKDYIRMILLAVAICSGAIAVSEDGHIPDAVICGI